MDLPNELVSLTETSEYPTQSHVREASLLAAAEAICARDLTREALAAVDEGVQRSLSLEPLDTGPYLSALELARVAHRTAKHALVLSNLGLVRNLAKRYAGASIPVAELVQEGSIALLRAVELFDYRRGLRFSTYAVWWIRNAFQRCLSEQASTVRAPLGAVRSASRASRFVWKTYGLTGEVPDSAQVAEHLWEAAPSVDGRAQRGQAPGVSLRRSVDIDSATVSLDQLVDHKPSVESLVNTAMVRQRLEHSMAKLPKMEAAILRRKFGFGDGEETPLSVIARDYNLSYELAVQLSRQALRRLRHELERGGIGGVN